MSDKLAEHNLFRASNFANVGIAFVSAVFFFQFAAGEREILDAAIVDPLLVYIVAFAVAAYAVYRSSRATKYFDQFSESFPLLVFSAGSLLAGVRGTWLWLMFAVAVIITIILAFAAKSLDGDDSDSPTINRRLK